MPEKSPFCYLSEKVIDDIFTSLYESSVAFYLSSVLFIVRNLKCVVIVKCRKWIEMLKGY